MPEVMTGMDAAAQFEADGGAAEAATVEAAKAALIDEGQAEPQDAGEGLLLGKFRSVDDLARSYQELERRLGQGQQQQQQAEAEPEIQAEPEPVPPPLTEQGMQRSDTELAAIRQSMLDQAGGEEEYRRLTSWAASNLPSERVNAYDEAIRNADQGAIMTALKAMQYDYMMANGYEPRLTGGRAPVSEMRGFESERQALEAMKDPRYSGPTPDPAYIREVEQKIAVSNVFSPQRY